MLDVAHRVLRSLGDREAADLALLLLLSSLGSSVGSSMPDESLCYWNSFGSYTCMYY